MNSDLSFHDAKRLYLEPYGDPMVTNTYLKIALVLLALVAVRLGSLICGRSAPFKISVR
jgi:hypothetical protein